MNPEISIILPVYNGREFIGDCIESVLTQTFRNFELIIINDGSEDNSGEICESFAQKDKRVKVIHKSNEGPSITRNLGVKQSSGNFIGFIDSDDVIQKDMYEKLYEKIKNDNAEIVSCGYKEINKYTGVSNEFINPLNGKESIKGWQIKKELEALLLQNKILGYASLCNKLYKRSYILKNDLIINEKIKIAEDLCFNINCLAMANNICAVNEALYVYRRVNDKSIMNNKNHSFYLHLAARAEILSTLKQINISNDVYVSCMRYEKSKTAAEYLEKIKSLLISKNKNRFQEINKLIHEEYFIESLGGVSSRYLVFKARTILSLVKIFLLLEKSFNINFQR